MRNRYYLFFLLTIMCSQPAWADSTVSTLQLQTDHLPPPFVASYEIDNGTMTLGITRAAWRQPSPAQWTYQAVTTPQGIASLFVKEITRQSTFGWIRNQMLTTEFMHHQKKRNESIVFDWQSNTANSKYKKDAKSLPITPQTFDALGFHILIMSNAGSLPSRFSVPVIRKNRLTEYQFRVVGNESLQTGAGQFETLLLERQKDNEERTTHRIWIATSHYGLPVQYEKIENDRREYRAQITSVTWPDHPNS